MFTYHNRPRVIPLFIRAASTVFFVLLGCLPVRAEHFLSVDLLDMVRQKDRTWALLAIIDTSINESDENISNHLSVAPCPLVDVTDVDQNGPCYGVEIRDSHMKLSNIRSRILARLGNTDYVLVDWTRQQTDHSSSSPTFLDIKAGYSGIYNGNADEFFDLSRLPGELDPKAPYMFLWMYYDDRLNLLYKKMISSSSISRKQTMQLKQRQKQWLKATLKACNSLPHNTDAYAHCLLEPTAQRVWALKKLRQELGLAATLQ